MAEHEETLMEKVAEKIHGHDSSSSSDSDDDKPSESSVESKVFRLFGRERTVHHVFGGGKPADIFLWRNKKVSAGALGVASVIWALFELLEYNLLPLVCHLLILALALLFLWSSATTFIRKSPTHISEVQIPKDPVLEFAEALRFEINRAFAVLRDIASGRDLKKFLSVCLFTRLPLLISFLFEHNSILHRTCNQDSDAMVAYMFALLNTRRFFFFFLISICFQQSNRNDIVIFLVIAGLWVLSVVGNWCNFLTLLYIVFMLFHTVPVLYEKYVDPFAEKAMHEIKKQYVVFDAKILSKIPRGPLKEKKD